MTDIVEKIQRKWSIQTQQSSGYFIRFKDANTQNCCVSNLEYIHPYDAFMNSSYKVDWDDSLTEKEIQFVKSNMDNFATLYKK
tara:strand:- start:49 stop:297 length:249 start_codon:yes stop_codon:yes gene_type:complete